MICMTGKVLQVGMETCIKPDDGIQVIWIE